MRVRAMTLVEVMAALVIVSLLAAATLAVTVSLSRSEAALAPTNRNQQLQDSLQGLLQRELLHAQRFRNTQAGFEIQSLASLDERNLECRHLSSVVGYEVRICGGEPWLIRTQKTDQGKPTAELICQGVRAISLVDSGTNSGKWQAMPETTTAKIDCDQGKMELSIRIR